MRTILDDPAYAAWFIDFKPQGPYHSPKCDTYSSPPKCSNHYHMEEQTPGYPTGDGNCAEPCDCGNSPCGFYLWNHSSTAVVNGQTFQDWFVHSYMFNEVGSSPLVSGCVLLILGQLGSLDRAAARNFRRNAAHTPAALTPEPHTTPRLPHYPLQFLLGRFLAGHERQLPRRQRGAHRGGHGHDARGPAVHH